MGADTPNYNMKTYDKLSDVDKNFEDFRTDMMGPAPTTNIAIIDEVMKANEDRGVNNGTSVAVLQSGVNPNIPTGLIAQEVSVTVADGATIIRLDIQSDITGGAITIKKNGLTAKPLLMPDLTPIVELLADIRFYEAIEDGANFILAPKGATPFGDAQPEDVFLGKTFKNVDGEQTGIYVVPTLAYPSTNVTFLAGDANRVIDISTEVALYNPKMIMVAYNHNFLGSGGRYYMEGILIPYNTLWSYIKTSSANSVNPTTSSRVGHRVICSYSSGNLNISLDKYTNDAFTDLAPDSNLTFTVYFIN